MPAPVSVPVPAPSTGRRAPARLLRASILAVTVFLLLPACGATPSSTSSSSASSAAAPAACPPFTGLPLAGTPTSRLADHLRLTPLEGLAPLPRPRSIMAAPEPDAGESRLYLEAEDGRKLVILATELFRRPGDDFDASVERWLSGQGGDIRPLDVPPPLTARLIVPDTVVAETDAALIARVVVANAADDTVQHLGFFVTPDVVADASGEGCVPLVERVAETLAPGERTIAAAGGAIPLSFDLAIEAPPGYAHLVQAGPDFDVHTLYPLVALGEPHAQLGIYLGHHPSSHSGRAEDLRTRPGRVLRQDVTWHQWTTSRPGGRTHHQEAMVEVGQSGGLWAHLFFVTDDPARVDELTAIAESLGPAADAGAGEGEDD